MCRIFLCVQNSTLSDAFFVPEEFVFSNSTEKERITLKSEENTQKKSSGYGASPDFTFF